jgi:hypothetical protein
MPAGEQWWIVYIQDAIDYYGAQPCPACVGDREPAIAYNVRMRTDDGKSRPRKWVRR